MGFEEVKEFKRLYKAFLKTVKYIEENYAKLEKEGKMEKVRANFLKLYQDPLDESWEGLTDEEQNKFLAMFTHAKRFKLPF